MSEENDNKQDSLTAQGTLVVTLTRALFESDIEKVFDILGSHMDENSLTVSAEMIAEYKKAGRIAERKIIHLSRDS